MYVCVYYWAQIEYIVQHSTAVIFDLSKSQRKA